MRQSVSRSSAFAVALAGASAVLLGAFGAHALKSAIDPSHAQIWETAVKYQFWHALALGLAVAGTTRGNARRIAISAFAAGIVLFSGSLYLLALGAPDWVGIVTPFGGLAFVLGWIALGFALHRSSRA